MEPTEPPAGCLYLWEQDNQQVALLYVGVLLCAFAIRRTEQFLVVVGDHDVVKAVGSHLQPTEKSHSDFSVCTQSQQLFRYDELFPANHPWLSGHSCQVCTKLFDHVKSIVHNRTIEASISSSGHAGEDGTLNVQEHTIWSRAFKKVN